MEVVKPKFIDTEYAYYDDEGLKIKDDSPQWIKDEYKQFMDSLDESEIKQD